MEPTKEETKNQPRSKEQDQIQKLQQQNKEQAKIISEQMERLEAAEASQETGKKVFTYNMKKYQVNAAKFSLIVEGETKVVTAEELAKDRSLIKQLLESKSGLISEVVKKEPAKKDN